MEFCEFAEIMHSILAGGKTVHEFTQTLFENIVDPEDVMTVRSPSTYKGYYSGGTGISRIAREINKNLDVEKFAAFLGNLPDGASQNLCDAFANHIKNVTPYTIPSECAELFQNIILDSTKSQSKNVSAKKQKLANSNSKIPIIKKNDVQLNLAVETQGKCPNDNCNKLLYIKQDDNFVEDFTVTLIDPTEGEDCVSNLIALCHDCSQRYLLSKNDASMIRMKEIKQMLADEGLVGETIAQLPIETGVERLLRKIADGSSVPATSLVMDPVRVDEKITTDRALLLKVTSYVNGYYTEVHEICKALDKEGILKFNSFCRKIKYSYETLEDLNLKQMEIFQRMVDWLSSTTNEESLYCEIVISYFIQKCEVFHAITE